MSNLSPPPFLKPGPPVIREGVGARLVNQFVWYILIIWGPIFSLPFLLIVNFLAVMFARTLAPVWLDFLFILIGYGLASWACAHWVTKNHNGVFGRFQHYLYKTAHPGLNFFHPRPIWRILAEISLEPEPFNPDATNVDTGTFLDLYLPGEKSGTGQVNVDGNGSVIVTDPCIVALQGGLQKVLTEVKKAVVAGQRQYCAQRTFEWLKNDPESEGAAVYSGRQQTFFAPVLVQDENGILYWDEEEWWISVAGLTLDAFLAGYGVAMFRFTVQDYTPSGAGLRGAQDLVAIQERALASSSLKIDELNREIATLRLANPEMSVTQAAEMAASNLNLAELKYHHFEGRSGSGVTPFVAT